MATDCDAVLSLNDDLYETTDSITTASSWVVWTRVESPEAPSNDTTGSFPMLEGLGYAPGQGLRSGLPFGHIGSVATDGENVYNGWGERPEVRVLSPNGSLRRVFRWEARELAITEADWRAYESDLREFLRERPGASFVRREGHPRAPEKPFYGPVRFRRSAFIVGEEGHLWVRHYTRVTARPLGSASPHSVPWTVLDADGRWLGEVETPANFEVVNVRAGLVLGVSEDALGVETVRVYRVVRRGEGP